MGKSAEADRATDGRTGAEREELAKKLAAERIQRALQKIERAQNLLNEAAAELCPIVGMCGRWERISEFVTKLQAEIEEAFHAIDALEHAQQGEGGR